MSNYQKPDRAIVDAIGRALEAELKGQPKQWFVTRENHRGGLKLGIGMFNPGICRVADMFYHGEPTDAHRRYAALIVAAVNACYAVNPKNPSVAAHTLPRLVNLIQELVEEAWSREDDRRANKRVYYLTEETFTAMKNLVAQAVGKGGT